MTQAIKYFLSGFIFFFCSISFSQQRKIDSLLMVLKTVREDTNKVNTLHAVAREMELIGDYEKGISYVSEAKQLAEKLNFKKGIANSLGGFGNMYYRLGNYPAALKNYFAALKMDEALNNTPKIATRLGNIGLVYMTQADYPKALNYLFKALKTDEHIGNKSGTARHLGNIGLIYWHQTDYSKALGYYSKALKIYEELGDEKGIAIQLSNIGIVYMEQAMSPSTLPQKKRELLSKALDYYFKALKKNEELGSKSSIAIQLGNIGNVYREQEDYDKALDYYLRTLEMKKERGSKGEIASVLGNIGSFYFKIKKYAEAEKYLKRSTALADSVKDFETTKEFNRALSLLYSTTGNYKLSLERYQKYIAARDSITNDANTKKQTQQEMQYAFDKKQTADSIQNAAVHKQEQIEYDQKIKQQKIYTYGGILGFLMMLVVAGISFRAFKSKQKANEIISAQKHLVEEKQKEILDSIHYANRIQKSLLPTEKYVAKTIQRLSPDEKQKDLN